MKTSLLINKSEGLVHILGWMQGQLYALIAYELMDGDLLQLKKEMGEFPPAEAVNLLAQVSLGLVSLYRLGVIHGDIKPENILFKIQEDDTVVFKIADYESAQLSNTVKRTKSKTGTNMQMLTVEYAAPDVL